VYLREKILLLFDDKFIDDILDILPENTLSASASRIKLRKINSLLKKSKAVFNPVTGKSRQHIGSVKQIEEFFNIKYK